jgi:elongation factor P
VSGKVIEKVFHSSDKAEEADMDKQKAKYLYENRGEFWFCDPDDPSKRRALGSDIVGNSLKFIPQNYVVETLLYNDNVIGIKIPIKIELTVKEAPPAIKGNTTSGANKQIVLETGAVINAPIFINEGDVIRVNTENGEYTERVEKG